MVNSVENERLAFEAWADSADHPFDSTDDAFVVWQARAALAAAPVQAQEPVAYADPKSFENFKSDIIENEWMWAKQNPGYVALYRAPVQPVAVPDGWRDAALESAVQAVVERAGESEKIDVINAFDAIRSLKKNRHALPESCSSFAAPAAQGDALEGELTKIVMSGAENDFPGFLDWIANRLVYRHGDNPNIDYVQTLRLRASQIRTAIAAKAAS